MSDFLATLAARTTGTAPVLMPRRPFRFEDTDSPPAPLELPGESTPTAARQPDSGGAPVPSPLTSTVAAGTPVPGSARSTTAPPAPIPADSARTPSGTTAASAAAGHSAPALPHEAPARPSRLRRREAVDATGGERTSTAPGSAEATDTRPTERAETSRAERELPAPGPVPAVDDRHVRRLGLPDHVLPGVTAPGPAPGAVAPPWHPPSAPDGPPPRRGASDAPDRPGEQGTPGAAPPSSRATPRPAPPPEPAPSPRTAPGPFTGPLPGQDARRSRRESEAGPTTVHVTIGRVEVRVPAPAPRAPHPSRPTPAVMSLEQYLSRRAGGA